EITIVRADRRKQKEIRPFEIILNPNKYAEGSSLIKMGSTQVLCCATLDEYVPPFIKDTGKGWIDAEYSMLPRSSQTRVPRESVKGKIKGRTHEIQRLIGRSLRAVVDLSLIPEKHIIIDCDVLQADGGTRTASITGGFIALVLALRKLLKENVIEKMPVERYLAAISVGILDGEVILDLNYEEDSACSVDMNLVMTDKKELVEVQATGEEEVFDKKQLDRMIEYGWYGIQQLIKAEKNLLAHQLL
ncbi:MAG: ribonuclease PH, partial [Candidatus Hydrogenedentota bacterium]